MSIPKEPRQQMINLMYLFLTAMLALNVSSEILNAFTLVNEGLERSVSSIQEKNDQLIAALEKKKEDDPETATKFYNEALRIENITEDAIEEIDSMIAYIYRTVGRKEDDPDQLVNPGNLEVSTNYMVNDKHAEGLKFLIQNTRDSFAAALGNNPAIIDNLPLEIDQPPSTEGEKKSWEEYNFYGIPAVAAVTLLTKFKNDFYNAESTVLEYLANAVIANKFTFDALTGRAISNRNILNLGETYKADIFVSATSNASQPTVYLGPLSEAAYDEEGNLKRDGVQTDQPPLKSVSQKIEESENGIVTYEVNASSAGVRSYSGVIEIINPNNGKKTYYPFKEEYTVSESMAVVSAEKMNVFYVGVDNPVSVSAPGYQHSQIRPVLRGPGSIKSRGQAGKYTVKITDNKDIFIDVYAKPEGEAERKIGTVNFRGKNIPTPDVYMGNSTGPAIKSSELRAQTGIYALSEGFDFEVKFNIRSFELTYKKARQQNLLIEENKGAIFNQTILGIIRNAGPGDRIWLDDIKIGMPDGTTRTESMSLKVF